MSDGEQRKIKEANDRLVQARAVLAVARIQGNLAAWETFISMAQMGNGGGLLRALEAECSASGGHGNLSDLNTLRYIKETVSTTRRVWEDYATGLKVQAQADLPPTEVNKIEQMFRQLMGKKGK